MFVRTERLVLRRFSSADAEAFAAYRSDPEVARFQSWERAGAAGRGDGGEVRDRRSGGARRLLERVGFRQEGLRLSNAWFKGEWTDDLIFGLLRRDYVEDYLNRSRPRPAPSA